MSETSADMRQSTLLCCPVAAWNWTPADAGTIQDEVIWLAGVTARCGVGPRTCVRVSCECNSGIYLCNDVRMMMVPPRSVKLLTGIE